MSCSDVQNFPMEGKLQQYTLLLYNVILKAAPMHSSGFVSCCTPVIYCWYVCHSALLCKLDARLYPRPPSQVRLPKVDALAVTVEKNIQRYVQVRQTTPPHDLTLCSTTARVDWPPPRLQYTLIFPFHELHYFK